MAFVFPLSPTLVPPVIAGTEVVLVEGTIPGEFYDVVVRRGVQSLVFAFTATTCTSLFDLGAPLEPGDEVTVTHGAVATHTLVAARAVPPVVPPPPDAVPAPALSPFVDPDAEAVEVVGAYPGAYVAVYVGGVAGFPVGQGIADPRGRAILETGPLPTWAPLEALQRVAGVDSGTSLAAEWADSPPFRELEVAAFAGQTALRVRGVTAGTEITVTASASGASGRAWADSEEAIVELQVPIERGETIRVEQSFPTAGRAGPSLEVEVVIAGLMAAPAIVEPVWAGTRELWVTGLVPGATLTIEIEVASEISVPSEVVPWLAESGIALEDFPLELTTFQLGPRPATFEARVQLPFPIGAGATVRAIRTLELSTKTSADVVVRASTTVRTPVIVPGPFDCGRRIGVLSVPGADVTLLELAGDEGLILGFARAVDPTGYVAVPTVGFRSGTTVFAAQQLPSVGTDTSLGYPVAPGPNAGLPTTPRVLPPAGIDHDSVWLSAVNPGAIVWVREALPSGPGPVLGWAVASDPIVRVPLNRVLSTWPLVAFAALCEVSDPSPALTPVPDPSVRGLWAVRVEDVEFTGTDANGTAIVEGRLYLPVDPATGLIPPPGSQVPLVIIGHGDPPNLDVTVESYEGYAYLGEHLATFGIVVFSGRGPPAEQFGQHEQALDGLQSLVLADGSDLGGALADGLVVLGGQSDGADLLPGIAVNSPPSNLAAIILIAMEAPSPDFGPYARQMLQVPVIAISGTMDYGQPVMGWIDSGTRPSLGLFIEHAGHNAFNSAWQDYVDGVLAEEIDGSVDGDNAPPGALPGAVVQDVVRDAVSVLLRYLLLDDGTALDYLRGPARPTSFAAVDAELGLTHGGGVHVQFLGDRGLEWRGTDGVDFRHGAPVIVDNFGNFDGWSFPNTGSPPSAPVSPQSNSLALPNLLDGVSVDGSLRLRTQDGGVTLDDPTYSVIGGGDDTYGLFIPEPAATTRYESGLDFDPKRLRPSGLQRRLVLTDSVTFRAVVDARIEPGEPFDSTPLDVLVALSTPQGDHAVRLGAVHPIAAQRLYPTDLAPDPSGRVLARQAHRSAPARSFVVPLDAFHSADPDLEVESLSALVLRDWTRADLPIWFGDVEFVQ